MSTDPKDVSAADIAKVAALPAAIHSRATPLARHDVDLLAKEDHHAALRKHAAVFASKGLDVEKAIADAATTADGLDLAQRLQALADRAWQAVGPGLTEAHAQVKLIAKEAREAPASSPLQTDLGAFAAQHAEDRGDPERAATRNHNEKAKASDPKAK